MKKITLGLIAALSLCACDHIDEADRLIEVPVVEAQRSVLIEEFTGQNCSNCPKGHQAIRDEIALHGSKVVAVSIHGGGLAYNEADWGDEGLANAESEALTKAAGIKTWPCIVVDRNTAPTDFNTGLWPKMVRDALSLPTTLEIETEATMADGVITVVTTMTGSAEGNLNLWLTENDIVAEQNDGGKYIADYEHNHVFRAWMNGENGESVSVHTAEPTVVTTTFTPRANWVPAHLHVVAFVANASGVLNVTQTDVKL